MWSSNFQFSDLFYTTVGWIASFHIADIVTWPCGYEEYCPMENAFVPNPADCHTYYRCLGRKWKKFNCGPPLSTHPCGIPAEYCREVTCPGTTTYAPIQTSQGHRDTSGGTKTPPNINITHYTTMNTATRKTTIGNGIVSESTTLTKTFTKERMITIMTTQVRDISEKPQTTMQIMSQSGDPMPNKSGPIEGGVIAGTVIAVLLVLVILILGLLWWKRRDMLLSLFNKGKGKNSTNEYDSPYVYQDPHGIKSIKENPTKNNNESSVHIYSEPAKTSPKPTYNGDQSPVLMRNNTLYSTGTDEPFYNTADDPKYDATDSNDYTYTQPPGFKSDTKENHYYTTPGKADDVYYSTVAKEVDGANEQDRRQNGGSPQNSIPQYADVIPRSKRASDPNVADDIDDYCLEREPNPTNQQEPYYFVLENPAATTHYQNTC